MSLELMHKQNDMTNSTWSMYKYSVSLWIQGMDMSNSFFLIGAPLIVQNWRDEVRQWK